MNNRYDIAVIGSGLGGLVCAYILSQNGYRVAVFEKHHTIGGCLQTFVRDGVRFETGMHYIGSMRQGEALNRFFKYLRLDGRIELQELDRDGYDVISIGSRRFRFANGRENFVETLARDFPDQRRQIERYIDTIDAIAKSSPLYSFRNFDNISLLDPSHVKRSVNESIEAIVDDPLLCNVLVGNVPLYAGVKDKTPMYIHSLISDFYMNSAFRVVGGSDKIASVLADNIRAAGGEIFTSSPVVAIECDQSRATSIRIEDGRVVEASYFISDIHPEAMLNMLSSHLIRKAYRDRIGELQQTVSNFTVYIKFRPHSVEYMNHNFFWYRDRVWGGENYTADDWPRNFLYMHQASSIGQRWADGGLVLAYMRWDEVERWASGRDDAYRLFKQQRAERLLEILYSEYPALRGNVERYWTSSPLTYSDYTGTKHGSMYGVMRDKDFPTQTLISQRTKIPNLYLTGQNINSHGILGVIIGAIITCSEFLGINRIVEQIRESNNE